VNGTLTNLIVGNNKIGDSGADHLSEALTVNRTFADLDESGNNIGDSGAVHLSEAQKVNRRTTLEPPKWKKRGNPDAFAREMEKVLPPLEDATTMSSHIDLLSKFELIQDRRKLFLVFSFFMLFIFAFSLSFCLLKGHSPTASVHITLNQ